MKPPTRLVLALLFTGFGVCVDAVPARQPNVILILTDDQGSVDLNIYGATDLVTPNMDAIARRGVRFTQFYSAAPVCSPSRAGCLTGRNPHRAGLPSNASSQHGARGGMPGTQFTLAEMLKGAGYATAHIGKWHLGYTPEMMPNAQGFDYSYGHMGGCIDNYSHFFYWNGPNRHDLWRNGVEIHEPGVFFGDLMVREANAFMTAHRDEPFFIYFAINQPHYPYQGDPKWLEHYADLPSPRNLYAAFISTIDDRLGQLMENVRKLGLEKDTIVILQSDHGHSTEGRAHGGGGSSGPHRGAKFDLLEGGIRVPAMISWPGHIPANTVRSQLATGCDWFPTLAALCGATLPDHILDGKDLSAVLGSASAPSPHETFFWASGNQIAARKGPWKLYGKGNQRSLYNIATDPGESDDLSKKEPAVFNELKGLFEDWKRFRTEQ